jgi:hypothetical protein
MLVLSEVKPGVSYSGEKAAEWLIIIAPKSALKGKIETRPVCCGAISTPPNTST